MKKLKEELKYGKKGITLISLVVTIIVLLILAGVTIATLTGDNGLITKTNEAKKETEQAGDKELIRLAVSEAQIGENGFQELNANTLQEAIDNQFDERNAVVSDNGDGTFTVSCLDTLKDYKVTSNNIENALDWNEVMSNAVAPESQDEPRNEGVIGIGVDGKPVDMDLWEYSFDEETGGYALNTEEVLLSDSRIAGYRGRVIENGTIEGCIPQYIKSKNNQWFPVTSLYRTFQGNDTSNEELKKLTIAPQIPPTIRSMLMTFESCENLQTVMFIPGSVKTLRWTFCNTTALEEMPVIGHGIEDMTGTFSGCNQLKKISKIPNSVTNLDRTFSTCTSLKEVPLIPYSVVSMQRTFYGCIELEMVNITIPKNVNNVIQTFSGCIKLTGTITINSNPEQYVNFLQNTTNEIILKGDSTMLETLREWRENVSII